MTDFLSAITSDPIAAIILVIIAIVVCIILFFILKNGLKLLINAIAGVAILFIITLIPALNSIIPIGDLTVAKVVVCAVGGVIGVIVIIILSFFGITI